MQWRERGASITSIDKGGSACRVPWGEALLSMAATKEQHDASGQVLLRGLTAKVGISSGPITRLCPHPITGIPPAEGLLCDHF